MATQVLAQFHKSDGDYFTIDRNNTTKLWELDLNSHGTGVSVIIHRMTTADLLALAGLCQEAANTHLEEL